MWSSKRSAGAARVRRLCTLGLPLEGLAPALMRALCREVHCDAGLVLWFDSHGEIANLYAPHLPSPAVLGGWFAPPPDSDAAAGPPTRVGLPVMRIKPVETCADDEEDRSAGPGGGEERFCPHRRLCRMAVPGDSTMHRACCAVVRQGVAVASLMLYRPATDAGFTSDERAAVKAAARYLSLRSASSTVNSGAAMYRAFGEQALLLCEADGSIIRASANGYTLLAQASGCPVNRKSVPHQLERAGRDLLLRALAATLPALGTAACDDAPGLMHLNEWGLFRLRALLADDGPCAVLIERADHLLVRLVDAMWHLDLSVQQGEVLLLLSLGMSHEMIAHRMSVSPNTADYHIRQLYTKLGVHTRNEAVACVLDTSEMHVAA